jgi:hypothetical protein
MITVTPGNKNISSCNIITIYEKLGQITLLTFQDGKSHSDILRFLQILKTQNSYCSILDIQHVVSQWNSFTPFSINLANVMTLEYYLFPVMKIDS